MVGARLKFSTLAAITVLAAGAAQAADYIPPQQPMFVPPPAQNFAEGWYLRGFVGTGINDAYHLDYLPSAPNVGNGFVFDQNSNSDTFFVGGGVGYNGTAGCASTSPANIVPGRRSMRAVSTIK